MRFLDSWNEVHTLDVTVDSERKTLVPMMSE